jgi:GNAT superfamily N-acetyltransferase
VVKVRRLAEGDLEAWQALWRAYLHFYRSSDEVTEEVSAATFAKLAGGRDGYLGLVAEDGGGRVVGIANLVFHPSTWSTAPYCYLEDLYVDPSARGSGAAAGLIEAVYREADSRGATRTYWETQEFNSPARSLYDKVAHRTSFIIYER